MNLTNMTCIWKVCLFLTILLAVFTAGFNVYYHQGKNKEFDKSQKNLPSYPNF